MDALRLVIYLLFSSSSLSLWKPSSSSYFSYYRFFLPFCLPFLQERECKQTDFLPYICSKYLKTGDGGGGGATPGGKTRYAWAMAGDAST